MDLHGQSGAGRALWLPDLLGSFGLEVVLEPGWETRGSADFFPTVVVAHHTATKGSAVRVCVTGYQGLPGPLCQVVLTREGVAHVIAAGRANHAGKGGWLGYSGNRRALGIEAENDGSEPWPAGQVDAFHRCAAAMLAGIGKEPSHLCGHKEWAPGRKTDPHTLDMSEFRAAVGLDLHWWRTRHEGDDMALSDEDRKRLDDIEEKLDKALDAIAGWQPGRAERSLIGRIGDALHVKR